MGAYGAALIEEFIEGREFTVLVAEPRHPGGRRVGSGSAGVRVPRE